MEQEERATEVELVTETPQENTEVEMNTSSDVQSETATALEAQNQELLQKIEAMTETIAQLKDFTGFGDGIEPEPEPESEEKQTPEFEQLSVQVQAYQEAMQAHIDASLKNLTDEKQALIKKLGGEDALAQFRALTSLQEAGLLANNPKPKNQRKTHQGRTDVSTMSEPTMTRQQVREAMVQDMREAGLI